MSTVSPTEQRLDKGLPENELLRLYRQMVLIRRFEERAEEQYTRDRIGGYLHLNIGEEATVVGQRELTHHGHLTPTDQPHIGNGLVGGATRPGGDDGGAPPGAAGAARDAGGCNGCGQGHLGEDRRQASGQPRLPHPRRPQEQDVGVRIPASASQ